MLVRLRAVSSLAFLVCTVLLLLGSGCSQRSVETLSGPAGTTPISGSNDSTQIQFSITATNPATTISFCVPTAANTLCEIRNVVGYHVKTLWNGPVEAGCKSLYWDLTNDDGEQVVDGFYYAYLQSGIFSASKKLVLRRTGDGKL
jgi:hypothetical protein